MSESVTLGRPGIADTRAVPLGIFVATLALSGCMSDRMGEPEETSGSQESSTAGHWELTDADVIRTIGEAEGLLIARSGNIVLLDDGTTVMQANGNEINILDITGGPVRTVGRSGSGPGEFMFTPQLFHFDGGVGAFDLVQSRFSLFDREGDHLQTVTPVNRISAIAGSPTASIIIGRISSPIQHIAYYARYSLDGAVIDTIGPIVGRESARVQWRTSDGIIRNHSPDCTPAILASMISSTLLVADGGSGHLSAVADDKSVRRIHETQNRKFVSQELLDRVQAAFDSRGVPTEIAREALARIGEVGDPEPDAWDMIIPDQKGRIWLQLSECRRTTETPSRTWEVVDVSGGYLGTISIPIQYSLRAVHGNTGIAYSFDSLGVASVIVLRMPIPD